MILDEGIERCSGIRRLRHLPCHVPIYGVGRQHGPPFCALCRAYLDASAINRSPAELAIQSALIGCRLVDED